MTEESLEALEARWRASGTAEDEGAWLLARARAGQLTHEWLELAAFCGHAGAAAVVDPVALEAQAELDWPERLAPLDREALALGAVEAVRALAPLWGELGGDQRLRLAVDLAAMWTAAREEKALGLVDETAGLLGAIAGACHPGAGLAAAGRALLEAVRRDARGEEARPAWAEAIARADGARSKVVRRALAAFLLR